MTDQLRAPGLPSPDMHAAVGKQLTLRSPESNPIFEALLSLARKKPNQVGLVAKGFKGGLARGWFFVALDNSFQSDRTEEMDFPASLLELASTTNSITFTVVPSKSARRMGVDRDEDGFFDRTELEAGSDPASPLSVPGNRAPAFESIEDRSLLKLESLSLRVSAVDPDPGQGIRFGLASRSLVPATIDPLTGVFVWKPAAPLKPGDYRVTVLASDDGTPSLTNRISFKVVVRDGTIRIIRVAAELGKVELAWESSPGKKYRVQATESLVNPEWNQLGSEIVADISVATVQDDVVQHGHRFYRIELIP